MPIRFTDDEWNELKRLCGKSYIRSPEHPKHRAAQLNAIRRHLRDLDQRLQDRADNLQLDSSETEKTPANPDDSPG